MFAGVWLGRDRSPRQLAALMAAMGIASELWKIHGTGVYVNWYYPFLLLGVFVNDSGRAGPPLDDHPRASA
jgi:hypothetical protein